jgi:hypothetical protein
MTPLVFAVLLAAADPGAGQPPVAPAPAPAVAPAHKPATDPNKVVCRWEDQVGTRVQVHRCMTQKQWDDQAEQTRQYFQDAAEHGGLNTARVSSGGPGG